MDLWHPRVCSPSIILLTFMLCALQTSSEITSGKATRRSNFDDKIQDIRMLWQCNKQRPSLCIGECVRDDKCASIFYNNVTGQCQGHSITFGNPDLASGLQDFKYYVCKHGEQYIGDYCGTDGDCVTSNSECRAEMCQCIPGYSFSPRTRECTVCSDYGNDFWEIRNHYISTMNVETLADTTLEDCLSVCVTRTNYTCVSLEYGRTSLTCYLSDITVLDYPERWYHDSASNFNISYYQRDCE